jgi:hypothetical protein
MRAIYLLRLDDACDTMDHAKWKRMEALLDQFNIKPMITVIPNNEDGSQVIDPTDNNFWVWLRSLEKKGWEICMHGNDHVYQTKSGGINPVQRRSEFAGLSYEDQCEKVRKGILKFKQEGIDPKIFVAPSHTFDKNTLLALHNESDIRIVSDTIALYPYTKFGIIFIPQQMNIIRNIMIPGIFTFCYHPSAMTDSDFLELEKNLQYHHLKFSAFRDINLTKIKSKKLIDKLFSFLYFLNRNIKMSFSKVLF